MENEGDVQASKVIKREVNLKLNLIEFTHICIVQQVWNR